MPDLTTAQAATELQVTPETVAAYCKDQRLPGAYRLPGSTRWRIPWSAIEALRTPPPGLLAPRTRRSVAQHRRTAA